MNSSLVWKIPLGALLSVTAWFAYQFGMHAGDWAEKVLTDQTTRVLTASMDAIHDSRKDVLREVTALRKDTMRQLDELRNTADARLSDIATRAEGQFSQANDTLAGISSHIVPTLDHVESITGHADEASAILFARNGLPAQLLGVTAAAKVTLGEAAQTMKTIRDTTATEGPATAAAIREVTQQAGGIATDVHTFTTAATRPVPWYRKVGSILYSGARVGAALF